MVLVPTFSSKLKFSSNIFLCTIHLQAIFSSPILLQMNNNDSNISIVADSPSCNTRAASSAGWPKKKNAPLPKTKTKSKQCTCLAQSLDNDGKSQRLLRQQDTLIQSCIALVLTKKNSKQKIAIISTSVGYLLLTLMVDECLESSGIASNDLLSIYSNFFVVVLFDYHWTHIELQKRTFSQTCPLEQLELATTTNIANNNSKSPFIGGQNHLSMIHLTFPIQCSWKHCIRMVASS
jgi:hypothetical protein